MARLSSHSVGEKIIGWGIGALCFLSVAYFAWYRLPVLLWYWASEVWWHWIPAIPACFLMFIVPIFTLMGAGSLTAEDRARGGHLWWDVVSYLGAIALAILILWAFMPATEWWVNWYWWVWGAAVVCSAAASAAGRMFLTVYEVDAPKVRDTFSREWRFNHGDANSPPTIGIAMSGGGIRSAAFNLGVLHALHDKGILRDVDVMSAVSGGSYTMSWYLLQPFYAAKVAEHEQREFKLDDVIDEMFRPDGRFQAYLCRDPRVAEWGDFGFGAVMDATYNQLLRALAAVSGFVGVYNKSGFVRGEYRERIQRLFQGLPSPSSELEIANKLDSAEERELVLDFSDFSYVRPVLYPELRDFAKDHGLPFFIFNATVLVERAYRHLLWPTACEFTADDVGSDVCGYRAWDEMKQWVVREHLTKGMSILQWTRLRGKGSDRERRQHRWVLMANLAPAISGAAIGLSYFNPKKPLREMKLATWAPFFGNLDLGYLLSREIWNGKGTLYVSDGGHCDNLGAYALIKRQCRRIIIVDAEHEKTIPYVFGGYTKLKERLEQEMHLILTVSDIDRYLESAKGTSKPTGPGAAVMTGEVKPLKSDPSGTISVIYIKLGLDRNRLDSYPSHVSEYARRHDVFPQDPTSNQSFTSEQFVAYRELGRHVAENVNEIITKMR